MPLRILIVDDHPLARDAIRTTLQFCHFAQPQVVGEAQDGTTALEMARQLHPDVITLDIGLPDIDGLKVAGKLKAEMPQVKVVMVTMHEEQGYREEAIKAGAVSYITKGRLMDDLPGCLEHLASQRSHCSGKDKP